MNLELLPSDQLPGFEIIRRLGSGGMGVVYEARASETGARVALKTIRTADASFLRRLKHEFRALQGIHHPNIVRLHELRQEDALWFVTMDLIDGEDFASWIRTTGEAAATTITEPALATAAASGHGETLDSINAMAAARSVDPAVIGRLRDALRQLCDGLDALHDAGLIHRDLKPANLMVSRDGRLTIVDFGLVHDPARELSGRYALGTVAYMAPEQARGDPLTPAADWYAVGVMTYEVLTGRLPFVGSSDEILAQKQAWIPIRPSTIVGAVPADLDELCVRLLDRDPRTRASAAQVRSCVGQAVASPPPPHTPVGSGGLFVGRSAELATIELAVRAVEPDRPAIVTVEGESGVGKTALLLAAEARLRQDGVTVLSGRCFDRETAAYAGVDAVIDALTAYLRRAPADVLAFAMPRFPALLRLLFPVIASLPPVADAPALRIVGETRELRARAFGAYRELFQRLAERRKIAIFIDDAQWLTSESWAFLDALLDPLAAAPIALVLVMRSDTAVQRAKAMTNPAWITQIRLGRLDDVDSATLVRDLVTDASPSAAVGAIVREAQGHPLFLHELARAALGAGRASAETSLEAVLHRRIVALPADDLGVLQVVAAASAPLPRSVVASATGLAGDRPAHAVAALQAGRLVASADEAPQLQIRLYHDRIRAAALQTLSPAALGALRRRLAEALEQHVIDPAVLATAWASAGEPRRAADHAQRAAAHAMAQLAFERAVHMYQLALAGTEDPQSRVALLTSLGEALASSARSAEAATVYMEGARTGTLDAVDDLLHRGAEQLIRSGHVDEGRSVLREVFERLGLPVLRTRSSVMRALVARRVQLRLRRIPSRVRSSQAPDTKLLRQIDACWSLGDMLALLDPVQAAAAHAHGLLLALRAGDAFRVARALSVEAAFVAMTPRGRARGRRLLERADSVARDSTRPELPGWLALGAGLATMLEGGFVTAQQHFARAELVFGNCIGTSWETGTARQLAAWNLAYRGDLRALRDKLIVGIDEAEVRDNRLTAFNLRCGPSHLASLADDRAEPLLEVCRTLLVEWNEQEYPLMHLCALFARTQALLYLERGHEALALLDAAAPAIRQSQLTRSEFYRIDLLALRARTVTWLALRGAGDGKYVRQAWAALAALRRERAPWGRAIASAIEAALIALDRRRDQARTALGAAATALEASGLQLHVEAARWHLARAAGASAPRYFADQGVTRPERIAHLLVPFVD